MAQKVEIEVVAVDSASGKLANIANVVTGINSAIGIAQTAFRGFQQVMDQTVNVAQDYAQQVRDMMLATGGTAEETSKLIQVIDDVGISYETLKTAMKMASKDGIEPNINSLAKLADQYNALAPGVERNQFLMDNFGRSGLDMARAMEQGGDALRQMAEEMDGALVLTDENIAASEEYRKNIDELNDSWQGLKVAAGNTVIPVLNQIMQGMKNTSQAQEDYNRRLEETIRIYGDHGDRANNMRVMLMQEREEAIAAADAIAAHGDALMNDTNAVETNTEAIDASIPSIEAQNQAMQQVLQSALWLTDNQKTYSEDMMSLQSQRQNEIIVLDDIIAKYGAASGKVDEQKIKIGELDQKIKDLQETHKQQTDQWVLDMMKQQGATVEMQLAYAEASGLIDQRSTAVVQAIGTVNQQFQDGTMDVREYRDMVEKLTTKIMALDGLEAYADIYITEHGGISSRNFNDAININQALNPNRTYTLGTGRASGGPVFAGETYTVGERGMEMFTPATNGFITPNNKLPSGGMVVNLTYAPAFSTASRQELLQNITPMLNDWYKNRLTS